MALHPKLKDLTVKKLRPAKYNPRTITSARLDKLQQSINCWGDLSGVVFNVRTGNLVSGHQRMKTIGEQKAKIVQQEHSEKVGTIAVGHIEVTTPSGVVRVPYRAVDWDLKREKGANIAANAHGGNFDKEKLALVLADLENVKEFDLDLVGLDPLTIRSLRIPTGDEVPGKNSGASRDNFKEYGEDIATAHECPKCHYRWG